MKLVPNWYEVLKHAWSIRLMVVCVCVIALEPVLSTAASLVLGHSIWLQLGLSLASGLFGVAAIGARIITQNKLREDLNGKPPQEG